MIALGIAAETPLGREVHRQALRERTPRRGDHVVIGTLARDPAGAARSALKAGASVLLESPGRVSPHQLRRLARYGRAFAGFHFRFEPGVWAARKAVEDGSVGLAWAANAEAVWAPEQHAISLAADLMDALLHLTGLEFKACTCISRDPVVVCAQFSNAVIGTVAAMPRPSGQSGEGSAGIRVLASHGYVRLNLNSPVLMAEGKRSSRIRIQKGGAARLLEEFVEGSGPSLDQAASILELLIAATGGLRPTKRKAPR